MNSPLTKTRKSHVQKQGKKMMTEHGFQGVPLETFEEAGRNQFITLLELGLSPESRVIDIGCGVLRLGYWLIPFLHEGCYYGIEPAQQRVNLGKEYLLDEQVIHQKQPRFDFNAKFDTSVFQMKFDFFLAGSIWTHCSKESIVVMLQEFRKNSTPDAVFLASYLPAESEEEDYLGSTWVGTSHTSNQPGCIKHSREWLEHQCRKYGLAIEYLERSAFDSQLWLTLSKQD